MGANMNQDTWNTMASEIVQEMSACHYLERITDEPTANDVRKLNDHLKSTFALAPNDEHNPIPVWKDVLHDSHCFYHVIHEIMIAEKDRTETAAESRKDLYDEVKFIRRLIILKAVHLDRAKRISLNSSMHHWTANINAEDVTKTPWNVDFNNKRYGEELEIEVLSYLYPKCIFLTVSIHGSITWYQNGEEKTVVLPVAFRAPMAQDNTILRELFAAFEKNNYEKIYIFGSTGNNHHWVYGELLFKQSHVTFDNDSCVLDIIQHKFMTHNFLTYEPPRNPTVIDWKQCLDNLRNDKEVHLLSSKTYPQNFVTCVIFKTNQTKS